MTDDPLNGLAHSLTIAHVDAIEEDIDTSLLAKLTSSPTLSCKAHLSQQTIPKRRRRDEVWLLVTPSRHVLRTSIQMKTERRFSKHVSRSTRTVHAVGTNDHATCQQAPQREEYFHTGSVASLTIKQLAYTNDGNTAVIHVRAAEMLAHYPGTLDDF